jgi:decaprenylphospho-beta-D-erythro-pentofuranosid-2-ulose 2-reductase
VRPGFVHTRMTRDLPAAPLASTPEAVARAVQAGLDSGSQTIWVPGALRWLMLVIRHIPRFLFRRMRQ